MRKRLARFRWKPVALFALMASITMGLFVSGSSGANAAQRWVVYAGGGGSGITVDLFRPDVIFINQGDTIEWVNPYAEIHTVTFLAPGQEFPAFEIEMPPATPGGPPVFAINPEASNPTPGTTYDGTAYANSGIMFEDDTYALTFTEQGVFEYLCIVHPFMTAEVHVLRPGIMVPTQERLDREAEAELKMHIAAGVASANAMRLGSSRNADGSTNWILNQAPSVGPATPMLFTPSTVNIAVGDTVTWNNNTFYPHTVTFTSGADVPPFAIPDFSRPGPPLITLNPQVLLPAVPPGGAYDGTGYANSGFYGAPFPSQSFTLKFTRAGSYSYVCVLHLDQGMAGVVNVGVTPGITPPATGSAGLEAGSSGAWALYSGIGLMLFSLAAGAMVYVRRIA